MSRQDEITGKRGAAGQSRSHAMNATKRTFGLNLQKVTVVEEGQKKTLRVTARTAKTLKKQGRVA